MDVRIANAMLDIYSDTTLTPLRVAQSSVFIDWNAQPSMFKTYPDFLYRYHFGDVEALEVAELARCITSYRSLDQKPYYQLNTPSAGNLHPIELYVQIRGV
ncbi:MAG TPA: hypothetical protein ENK90_03785, partial [Epsilonproteobacteria bacterium]|nr:hypothetical protein [Campylobacterota bacterium]